MNGLGSSVRNLISRYGLLFKSSGPRLSLLAKLNRVDVITGRPVSYFSTLVRTTNTDHERGFVRIAPVAQLNLSQKRFKKKRNRASKEEEEEEEEEDDDDLSNENPLLMDDILGETSDGSETANIDVNSMRLDAICKAAFGATRIKIEETFYKGDIRVNGEMPAKKSCELAQGDEIDMIRHTDSEDNRLVHIKRAIIEKVPDKASDTGRLKIVIRRWSNLVVEKHEQK